MNETGNKKWIFVGVFLFLGTVFLLKLAMLQIFDEDYKKYANMNAIRRVVQFPPRGYILDRNGELMVYNEVSYDLMVIPREAEELDTTEFCMLADMSKEEFVKGMSNIFDQVEKKRLSRSQPTPLIKQMAKENVATLEEKMYKYPGYFLQPRILRKYPKPVGAHILGYIGEADENLINSDSYYKPGDYVGKSGLEKSYEEVLRGVKGVKNLYVDNLNNPKGSYMDGQYDTTAVPGKNITCTIDLNLQEYGEQLMVNKKGGIVAIEPKTGEILAMVSSPTYDPNLLVGRGIRKNYPILLQDKNLPLFNRTNMDGYPPGSTFKLLNGLIGLQLGVITPETKYGCAGGFVAGGLRVGCHAHASPSDLRYSIQTSCNAYYCQVFRAIVQNEKKAEDGFNIWREYMLSFGIGSDFPDSDIPNTKTGLLPTAERYNKIYGKGGWKALTIISLAIGQGEMKVNVLQLANMTAMIANRGYFITPHLLKSIHENDTDRKVQFKKNQTKVDAKHFDPVIEGMECVVTGGTGRVTQIDTIRIGGKTGTAQNPHGKDHSVFIAFAPVNDPKIAIAVFVENSGFGATWAAPIASLMIEKYLRGKISRPDMEKRMFEGNLMNTVKPPVP
ncbi:MAG: penicillin-binding protein 2 [Flavobacteriales bacterium]|nr:penicillin-binding protein 2 [Flavobacteriales bacterium]